MMIPVWPPWQPSWKTSDDISSEAAFWLDEISSEACKWVGCFMKISCQHWMIWQWNGYIFKLPRWEVLPVPMHLKRLKRLGWISSVAFRQEVDHKLIEAFWTSTCINMAARGPSWKTQNNFPLHVAGCLGKKSMVCKYVSCVFFLVWKSVLNLDCLK